jgi:hypothetical protein
MPKIWAEESKVSLGLILIVVPVVLGCAAWMTRLQFLTETNAQTLDLVKQKQDKYSDDISDIKSDIKVIKKILEE